MAMKNDPSTNFMSSKDKNRACVVCHDSFIDFTIVGIFLPRTKLFQS